MPVEVHQFPVLRDNYAFLVRDVASGAVACIDTPDAAAILAELDRRGWRLTLILNTHWHGDHIGGNRQLQDATGCTSFAPAEVASRIAIDRTVRPGDRIALGATCFEVLDVGGHTRGHVAYHAAADGLVFVGDALFAMGCGKLLEGSPGQMWASLQRLAALPDATIVYPAHEYAEANARFAITVDGAVATKTRADEIFAARARGEPSVPTTIAAERATNPFLRAPQLIAMHRASASDQDAFAMMRAAKDDFHP